MLAPAPVVRKCVGVNTRRNNRFMNPTRGITRTGGARAAMIPATVTTIRPDRSGRALLDTGGEVRVHLPDVLWLRPGDRVMLYPYPDGWVAVLRVTGTPAGGTR